MNQVNKNDILDKREQEIWGLQDMGYEVHWFTDFHVRINGVLDIYPVNLKWHDLRCKTINERIHERGSIINESITKFVERKIGSHEQ